MVRTRTYEGILYIVQIKAIKFLINVSDLVVVGDISGLYCIYLVALTQVSTRPDLSMDLGRSIAGMVAHPVTQVIRKQAIVDILDLS